MAESTSATSALRVALPARNAGEPWLARPGLPSIGSFAHGTLVMVTEEEAEDGQR
ncbi:MAG TPA: hypothetical protein VIJ66_07230 [Solirubrobacteraceae bacterium]